MHYAGETRQPDNWDSTPHEAPVFLTGEPASEQLLFTRNVWGIEALTLDLPPLAGTPVAPAFLPPAAELQRLAALWAAGWDSLWAMYASSYDAIRDDYVPISGLSEARPTDWLREASPATLPASDLAAWRASIPPLESLADRYSMIAEAGEAAFHRGLSCVAVLPFTGVWSEAVGGRLLLITAQVHDSTDLLKAALDEF